MYLLYLIPRHHQFQTCSFVQTCCPSNSEPFYRYGRWFWSMLLSSLQICDVILDKKHRALDVDVPISRIDHSDCTKTKELFLWTLSFTAGSLDAHCPPFPSRERRTARKHSVTEEACTLSYCGSRVVPIIQSDPWAKHTYAMLTECPFFPLLRTKESRRHALSPFSWLTGTGCCLWALRCAGRVSTGATNASRYSKPFWWTRVFLKILKAVKPWLASIRFYTCLFSLFWPFSWLLLNLLSRVFHFSFSAGNKIAF